MGSPRQGITRVTYSCSTLHIKKTQLKRCSCQGLRCFLHFWLGLSSLMEGPSQGMEPPAPDMGPLQAAQVMLSLKILMSPMTIPTMLLLKRMEVWILVESWRSSSLFSSLSSLPSSWPSSLLHFFCSSSPLWLGFFPWLSPSRLFLPPSSYNSATLTAPPSQDHLTVSLSDLSFQKVSATTRSPSLRSLLRRPSNH